MKRKDRTNAEYDDFEDVDPQQWVSKLKKRFLSHRKLDVDPSQVSLRLVCFAGEEPTAEEEAAATLLNPRCTLRAAGVADGSSLLVIVAGTLAGARATESGTQRSRAVLALL